MEGSALAQALTCFLIAFQQDIPATDPEPIPAEIQNMAPVPAQVAPRRRAMAFSLPGFQRGQPLGSMDPWWYGYNFGDNAAGFYGGGNYTRYYAYSRGFPSIGDYPGPLPGRVWTNDPRRTPLLHQMPRFTQPGYYPDGPVLRGAEPSNKKVSGEGEPNRGPEKPRQVSDPKLTARITVKVPVEAKITIEGEITKQVGGTREFVSPELMEDIDYVYHLRAEWVDMSNNIIQREARVALKAGAHQVVLFQEDSEKVLIEPAK